MHFNDNQTLSLRVVGPIADERVWVIVDDGCNSCCYGEVWRHNAETKMKVLCFHHIWLHRKATTFNGNPSGKLKIPMAIRLQESDVVIARCVHSHEILENTHPMLVSQACQAKLGMTKRVRDGSITLDDYDAQSLEVARQVGTGLFVIRIDPLINDDYASNPLLNDLLGVNSAARDSDQSNSPDCFTHAIVKFSVVKFRGVYSRPIRLSSAVDSRILNSLLGRRIVGTNSGSRTKNWTQEKTRTSLFAVSRTTTLECATVVQYG